MWIGRHVPALCVVALVVGCGSSADEQADPAPELRPHLAQAKSALARGDEERALARVRAFRRQLRRASSDGALDGDEQLVLGRAARQLEARIADDRQREAALAAQAQQEEEQAYEEGEGSDD